MDFIAIQRGVGGVKYVQENAIIPQWKRSLSLVLDGHHRYIADSPSTSVSSVLTVFLSMPSSLRVQICLADYVRVQAGNKPDLWRVAVPCISLHVAVLHISGIYGCIRRLRCLFGANRSLLSSFCMRLFAGRDRIRHSSVRIRAHLHASKNESGEA